MHYNSLHAIELQSRIINKKIHSIGIKALVEDSFTSVETLKSLLVRLINIDIDIDIEIGVLTNFGYIFQLVLDPFQLGGDSSKHIVCTVYLYASLRKGAIIKPGIGNTH